MGNYLNDIADILNDVSGMMRWYLAECEGGPLETFAEKFDAALEAVHYWQERYEKSGVLPDAFSASWNEFREDLNSAQDSLQAYLDSMDGNDNAVADALLGLDRAITYAEAFEEEED